MATRLNDRDTVTEAKMSKTEWVYAAKRTLTEFTRAGGTDLAAQLTYFIVLAVAPTFLALFSLAALVLSGFQDEIVKVITDAVKNSNIANGSTDLTGAIESTLKSLLGSTSSGTIALIIGIVTALWSASAFVKAFSRASNKIYRVEETRGPVKLNLSMLAVTAALIVGILLLFVSMMLSQSMMDSILGPIFSTINMSGLLDFLTNTFIPIWAWVKWPFMLALLFAVVSLLYWATPNLKHKYRFISPGGVFAIIGIALALLALSVYMSTLASYSSYGAIGGVMAVLFVLWVVSIVLILGAAFDAEVLRGRQLAAGMPAEDGFELPSRGAEPPTKADLKYAKIVDEGREIRVGNLYKNQDNYTATFAGADALRKGDEEVFAVREDDLNSSTPSTVSTEKSAEDARD
ncbi:YihY/virulence factor BrkB family protein [Dermabacter vaginalis]|uniref:YihY/virulence factor BrkB family protein n=1 Tax=Dermabacter vaginalis TaxID=1630135 RepID=A0ABX6A5D0_9MICO|nr:YihY/virulence factor BrkB family protein [Dermabacter vaginalis]QEU11551.1 YihY/virulence factor BrkB family protein [Dermabacter vaginalis]